MQPDNRSYTHSLTDHGTSFSEPVESQIILRAGCQSYLGNLNFVGRDPDNLVHNYGYTLFFINFIRFHLGEGGGG